MINMDGSDWFKLGVVIFVLFAACYVVVPYL